MRNSFLILIALMIFGCNSPTKNIGPKIKYTGYYQLHEGGQIELNLDSLTPLSKLIPQLRTNNKLIETYKAYWIGYNDLMYSIAIRADSAIEPLLKFIDTTNSIEGKRAAILTLHLIGINCKIAGRTYEKFTNIIARNAMFKLLYKYDSLQPVVMSLLIRDPREYDLPRLFYIMNHSTNDCWAISSGLLRYDLKNIPINQTIPEKLFDIKIPYNIKNDSIDNELCKHVFKIISKKYSDFISVEDTLFNYPYEWSMFFVNYDNTITLRDLIFTCSHTDYTWLGANYQYYYKDGKIHFCSAMTCKKLWLNWWQNQNKSYKDSLLNSYKQIGKNNH